MNKEESNRRNAILAHNIATQVVAVEGISYYKAFQILDHAKGILENNMKLQRAEVPAEIRDMWGNIIEIPQADAQGKKEEVSL